MRAFGLVLLFLTSLCTGAAGQTEQIATYVLSPELTDGAIKALDVTIHLSASSSGVTRLDLPSKSPSSSELWRNLRSINVDGALSVADDGPAVRVIRAAPGARLTISYRVVSAYDHDPGADSFDTYQPTILQRWFWAYGEALFAEPEGNASKVRFDWNGPPELPFASSLQRGPGETITFDDLTQSVAVGGADLHITDTGPSGARIRVAIIGAYDDFSSSTFSDVAVRTISAERDFWKDGEGPFLVALAPLDRTVGRRSSRGEGRNGAFAIMATPDIPFDSLKTTIAHEYFHNWNPGLLGGMYAGDEEPAAYWFSEGFTDYYARRLLLRAGLIGLEEFVAAWNQMLLDYGESKAQNAPNSAIVKNFWTDPEIEKLPYQRGALLAAIWEQRLELQSTGRISIDDIMRAMRASVARGDKTAKSPELFVETAETFGLDVASDVQHKIRDGETITLPPNVFGPCLAVSSVTIAAFDRGFDNTATLKSGMISGVRPDSNAYAAGLRNGMTLISKAAGRFGDSRVPYVLRVKDSGAERLISYKPEGTTKVSFQQIELPPTLTPEQRVRCTRDASGG